MKPILFNTEMVKAILDGRKTQTRRVFSKTQIKYFDYAQKLGEMNSLDDLHENDFSYILQFSKYKVNDILYVRETFKTFSNITMNDEVGVIYKADNKEVILPCNKNYECEYVFFNKWRPSIHMPKKYARIFLKVTDVRVEKLSDMNECDLEREGFEYDFPPFGKPKYIAYKEFDELWDLTAKDGYKVKDNPYVFVYEFERVDNGTK